MIHSIVRLVDHPASLETHLRETRRGSVVLASLLALQSPGYGYGLLEKLEQANLEVDANTLYPLLRRLEKQGLLTSDWDTDGPRPRKYYKTSPRGKQLAETLMSSWLEMTATLETLKKGIRDE